MPAARLSSIRMSVCERSSASISRCSLLLRKRFDRRRSLAMEPVPGCAYPYSSMYQRVGLEVEGCQDSYGFFSDVRTKPEHRACRSVGGEHSTTGPDPGHRQRECKPGGNPI